MKKLKLSPESLEVTSFPTVSVEAGRGTVDANALDTKCVCDTTRAPNNCACSAASCPTMQPITCPPPAGHCTIVGVLD